MRSSIVARLFSTLLLAYPVVLAAQTTLVVVTGLGGEPTYDERFHTWAAILMDAAGERYGLADSDIIYLAADPERDPERTRARSTRDHVRATLAELASSLPPAAPVVLVAIGHGSYRDGVFKVNLPGPDMTAEDFTAALDAFGERPLVFANLTSASGASLAAVSKPGRVVITATTSGGERNAAVFARFFVAAFVGQEADVDNDGDLSILEAFNYARREVERDYDREQKILTEHALLDDNGDGRGSADPSPDGEDGRLAATLRLAGPGRATTDAASADDPELARLERQKSELEEAVAELRRRKDTLEREAYEDQLEELLVRLALIHREMRAQKP